MDRFCFIPSVSALDMATMNSATLSSVYSGGIAFPANASRAASFIASEAITFTDGSTRTNQAHPDFTRRQASWIFNEMQGINNTINCALKCPINVGGLSIIGSNTICSPSEMYSMANLATGLSITWNSSNTAIATVSNPTGNTVTVNKVGVGSFNLIATLTNSCGQSINVTKSITAYTVTSLPIPSGYFVVDFVECYNDAPLPITFTPNSPFGGIITINPSVLPHPLRSQRRNIRVTYTNPCTGASTSNNLVFDYRAPDCRPGRMNTNALYTIYPNPSNDRVNIDLRDQNHQPAKGETIWGELLDMMGQSKTKIQFSDNQATFSVRALKKGLYVLKIYKADQVESHQIAVE